MQFSFAILATALAALAQAKNINDCGDSTFDNQSSSGSPKISDCQQMARNIAGGGSWTIPCAEVRQHTFIKYGTCAMGAHCLVGGANIARIGNSDAIDLINESIKRFSFNGKVGAKGEMGCIDTFNEYPGVEWGLYHS